MVSKCLGSYRSSYFSTGLPTPVRDCGCTRTDTVIKRDREESEGLLAVSHRGGLNSKRTLDHRCGAARPTDPHANMAPE